MRVFITVCLFVLLSLPSFSQDYFYEMIEPGYIGVDISASVDRLNTSQKLTNLSSVTIDYKDNVIPDVYIGVGLFKGVEIGAGISYRLEKSSANFKLAKLKSFGLSGKSEGIDALSLTGKFGITRESESFPSVVLQTDFYIPKTGGKDFKLENPGFMPQLHFFKTLGENTDIYSSIGAGWDGFSDYTTGNIVISPELYVSEYVSLYAEYTGIYMKSTAPDNRMNLGVYWTAADVFALEGYAGTAFGSYFGKRFFGGIILYFTFNAFAK